MACSTSPRPSRRRRWAAWRSIPRSSWLKARRFRLSSCFRRRSPPKTTSPPSSPSIRNNDSGGRRHSAPPVPLGNFVMTASAASDAGLSLRDIGKRYGPNLVLSDVTLDVSPGEVLALLGENGAGKSTLSSIVAGVVKPTTGTMTWRGRPYAPHTPGDALSAGIGLIHQEMRLLKDLSIAE